MGTQTSSLWYRGEIEPSPNRVLPRPSQTQDFPEQINNFISRWTRGNLFCISWHYWDHLQRLCRKQGFGLCFPPQVGEEEAQHMAVMLSADLPQCPALVEKVHSGWSQESQTLWKGQGKSSRGPYLIHGLLLVLLHLLLGTAGGFLLVSTARISSLLSGQPVDCKEHKDHFHTGPEPPLLAD